MKNFKWTITVLAFVLTLALSVGAVYLRQTQMVNEPLFKRISELESVETVSLNQDGNLQVITVKLSNVNDFPGIHRQVNDEISRLLGQKRYRLVLLDERDDALQSAFYAVHLALYEGERLGNFAEMGDRVSQGLRSFGVENYSLFVDSEYIYIQIQSGDAYLYEVIKRNDRQEAGERV
ncbi:MAG: hypothetical protein KGZ63_08100 [Clostridiales bacterium]|jgi:hypothetical protein|nr:hypothetical protein [Clostridiales bacterium]